MRHSQLIGQSAAIATSGGWPRQFLVERECGTAPPLDEPARSRVTLPFCLWIVSVAIVEGPWMCSSEVLVVDREQAALYLTEIGVAIKAKAFCVCKCQGHFLD